MFIDSRVSLVYPEYNKKDEWNLQLTIGRRKWLCSCDWLPLTLTLNSSLPHLNRCRRRRLRLRLRQQEVRRNELGVEVSLKRLLVSGSGHYRCEVIAEHPTFRTETASATMLVLGTFSLPSFPLDSFILFILHTFGIYCTHFTPVRYQTVSHQHRYNTPVPPTLHSNTTNSYHTPHLP